MKLLIVADRRSGAIRQVHAEPFDAGLAALAASPHHPNIALAEADAVDFAAMRVRDGRLVRVTQTEIVSEV